MRILTWNVNALRTVLPFHPWTELTNKTIGGMLDAMNAEIICFQEHKARRDNMDKQTAVPPSYDAFFSFPHGKGGYSGTCTYVKSSYAVPLKAEEGITGLLLGTAGANSAVPKLVYGREERVGFYPDEEEVRVEGNLDGSGFEMKRLDMEGRSVVLDFGFFVIFNLYCPNETNDTRLPYKLNFLRYLQARVDALVRSGRNVIILGDINVCHKPIDNGEGGIQRQAEEHFNHPARRWFDDWVAPRGGMHDVTRECWPERRGMFTCWNTKLDARPSNYGARIDYILVTPGLLPWIKHSDIQSDVYGSDHCPVYVDLHESITQPDGTTLHLRELMNPPKRVPLPAALESLREETREYAEPPPFATKWWDEFSGKQRSLMNFFSKAGSGSGVKTAANGSGSGSGPGSARNRTASGSGGKVEEKPGFPFNKATTIPPVSPRTSNGIGNGVMVSQHAGSSTQAEGAGHKRSSSNTVADAIVIGSSPVQGQAELPETLEAEEEDEVVAVDDTPPARSTLSRPTPSKTLSSSSKAGSRSSNKEKDRDKEKGKNGQMKLSSFFVQPMPVPNSSKSVKVKGSVKKRKRSESDASTIKDRSENDPIEIDDAEENESDAVHVNGGPVDGPDETIDAEEESRLAEEIQAHMEQEQEQAKKTWGNIFAPKEVPKCKVHGLPCKSFVSKVQGTKGRKFWLCSKPVGQGWDSGRSKRPRDEVNPEFRCDYFVWDSALTQRQNPTTAATDDGLPSKKIKKS